MTDKACATDKAAPAAEVQTETKAALLNDLMQTVKQNSSRLKQETPNDDLSAEPVQQRTAAAQPRLEVPKSCPAVLNTDRIPNSLEQLSHASQDELTCLYHESKPGKVPDGDTNGRAIFIPGTGIGAGLSGIADTIWKGKVFNTEGGLVNKILGQDIVKAKVFTGNSWLDGKQSTIIDYKSTSLVAGFIRDEIREVSPGLYLGIAYARLPFNQHYPALFFALDSRHNK